MRAAFCLLALLCLVGGSAGYKFFQDELPNGGRVAHPCKDNVLWHGVGHLNVAGGRARNVFGLDFDAAGRSWTTSLCEKDSDGDGRTNGQELGDPQCIWTKGDIPQSTTGVTHPGVCDPYDSDGCRNKAVPTSPGVTFATQADWMEEACAANEFDCPALQSPDVRSLDLRLPLTDAPSQETTYMCMTFEWLDVTQDFHIIATEAIINNSYLMHHMLLFGCDDSTAVSSTPTECGMGGEGCGDLLSLWAVGAVGHCYHNGAGVRIGKTGFKKFMIQYHWNNPKPPRSDLKDSSGMTVYYTPQLRPYDMAMLWVGQTDIRIPPRSPHTLATSDCSSTCTKNIMTGDIHVTEAINHMHYLGVAMNIELHRDGQFLRNMTNDIAYKYDSPVIAKHHDPVVLRPGDMLRTNCQFAAPDKTVTTFEGQGTTDEMCYGFLSFYPKVNVTNPYCVGYGGYSHCDPNTWEDCPWSALAVFRLERFNETELYRSVTSSCRLFGPCIAECKVAIKEAMETEACLSNENTWPLIKWKTLPSTEAGRQFLGAMASCQVEMYADTLTDGGKDGGSTRTSTKPPNGGGNCDTSSNEAAGLKSTGSIVAALGCALGTLFLLTQRH